MFQYITQAAGSYKESFESLSREKNARGAQKDLEKIRRRMKPRGKLAAVNKKPFVSVRKQTSHTRILKELRTLKNPGYNQESAGKRQKICCRQGFKPQTDSLPPRRITIPYGSQKDLVQYAYFPAAPLYNRTGFLCKVTVDICRMVKTMADGDCKPWRRISCPLWIIEFLRVEILKGSRRLADRTSGLIIHPPALNSDIRANT
jgi:hypothetical protein